MNAPSVWPRKPPRAPRVSIGSDPNRSIHWLVGYRHDLVHSCRFPDRSARFDHLRHQKGRARKADR
jgi:hypothetical protein